MSETVQPVKVDGGRLWVGSVAHNLDEIAVRSIQIDFPRSYPNHVGYWNFQRNGPSNAERNARFAGIGTALIVGVNATVQSISQGHSISALVVGMIALTSLAIPVTLRSHTIDALLTGQRFTQPSRTSKFQVASAISGLSGPPLMTASVMARDTPSFLGILAGTSTLCIAAWFTCLDLFRLAQVVRVNEITYGLPITDTDEQLAWVVSKNRDELEAFSNEIREAAEASAVELSRHQDHRTPATTYNVYVTAPGSVGVVADGAEGIVHHHQYRQDGRTNEH